MKIYLAVHISLFYVVYIFFIHQKGKLGPSKRQFHKRNLVSWTKLFKLSQASWQCWLVASVFRECIDRQLISSLDELFVHNELFAIEFGEKFYSVLKSNPIMSNDRYIWSFWLVASYIKCLQFIDMGLARFVSQLYTSCTWIFSEKKNYSWELRLQYDIAYVVQNFDFN